MRIVFGRYPAITVETMKQWTAEVGRMTPHEAAHAKHRLDGTVSITIRKVYTPDEWAAIQRANWTLQERRIGHRFRP